MQLKSKEAQLTRRIKSIPLQIASSSASISWEAAEHRALAVADQTHANTIKEAADTFFALYRNAATEDRHLTLIAPAPAPASKYPWGLRHLLTNDIQLRGWLTAALRLSALCKVSLLLPQPALLTDLQSAKAALEDVMLDFAYSGNTYDELLTLGVTLGTPAALLDAATLCEEADFAVIDTDTLLHLTLATEPNAPLPKEQLTHGCAFWRLLEAGIDLLHRIGRFVVVSGRLADNSVFEDALLEVGTDAILTRASQAAPGSTSFLL